MAKKRLTARQQGIKDYDDLLDKCGSVIVGRTGLLEARLKFFESNGLVITPPNVEAEKLRKEITQAFQLSDLILEMLSAKRVQPVEELEP